jgi:hypothetical protein
MGPGYPERDKENSISPHGGDESTIAPQQFNNEQVNTSSNAKSGNLRRIGNFAGRVARHLLDQMSDWEFWEDLEVFLRIFLRKRFPTLPS